MSDIHTSFVTYVHFLRSGNPDESLVVLALRTAIGCTAVLGNLLIVVVFLRFPKFRQTQTNVLITLLSCSGVIVGLGILVRAITSHMMRGHQQYDRFTCIALGQPQIVGVVFGQLVVLALAIDRYSAVRMPCQYLHINLKLRTSLLLLSWVLVGSLHSWLSFYRISSSPCSQCNVGAATTDTYHLTWIILGLINSVLVIGFYARAVRLLKRQLASTYRSGSSQFYTLRVHQRAFIAISLIVLAYILFWCIPCLISLAVFVLNAGEDLRGYMSIAFGLCEGLNSSISVFIYLLKHQEIKGLVYVLFAGNRQCPIPLAPQPSMSRRGMSFRQRCRTFSFRLYL